MSEQIERRVFVIIPAFNEENSVARVLNDIPKDAVDEIVVVNNNSNDRTAENAVNAGATVLDEMIPGYGKACLKGISYVEAKANSDDIIVFLDADYSDHPEELPKLIDPILRGEVDLVIGSRVLGKRERGSMTVQQVFGNWLAGLMIRIMYGEKFSDLGPFRAIKMSSLKHLDMQDKNYGWTVEMQVKAIKKGISWKEIPVNYRKRIGFSKISGTLKGTIMAGYKIITTIVRYA